MKDEKGKIAGSEPNRQPAVAVVIPCFNEESTVGLVIRDFRSALPKAMIYVCDNASTDRTGKIAREAGATVYSEAQIGKGNAVRRIFSEVDADVYILVDGDDTYDADAAPKMVHELLEGALDMVVGCRISDQKLAYRAGHETGNRLLTGLANTIFGNTTKDALSGYRALSRRYVKSFPALARGFEIETEMMVHAAELRLPTLDVDTKYKARPEGSFSKLRTVRDGIRIVLTIAGLVKEERPLHLFGGIALLLAFMSLALGFPIVIDYIETGLVPRLPTALLASAIMLSGIISFFTGIVLDSVTHARREAKRIAYLQITPRYNANALQWDRPMGDRDLTSL